MRQHIIYGNNVNGNSGSISMHAVVAGCDSLVGLRLPAKRLSDPADQPGTPRSRRTATSWRSFTSAGREAEARAVSRVAVAPPVSVAVETLPPAAWARLVISRAITL